MKRSHQDKNRPLPARYSRLGQRKNVYASKDIILYSAKIAIKYKGKTKILNHAESQKHLLQFSFVNATGGHASPTHENKPWE